MDIYRANLSIYVVFMADELFIDSNFVIILIFILYFLYLYIIILSSIKPFNNKGQRPLPYRDKAGVSEKSAT